MNQSVDERSISAIFEVRLAFRSESKAAYLVLSDMTL